VAARLMTDDERGKVEGWTTLWATWNQCFPAANKS
jgi:hypothetical protein